MRCIVACRPKRICPTRTRPGPSDSSSESCTYAIPRVSDCTPHRAVDCCFPDRFFPPPNHCNHVTGHYSGQRRMLLPPRSPPAQAAPGPSRPYPLSAGVRDLLLIADLIARDRPDLSACGFADQRRHHARALISFAPGFKSSLANAASPIREAASAKSGKKTLLCSLRDCFAASRAGG